MGPDSLTALSNGILLVAAHLSASTDTAALAQLLYHANSVPLSPQWLRRVPDPQAAEGLLLGDATTRGTLEAHWHSRSDRHWLYFTPRARGRRAVRRKLYVSVLPDDSPGALSAAVEVMAQTRTAQFKVARQARALLRPDRMVIYLASPEELDELAGGLAHPLAGLRPQGVPFSGELGGSAALSWGADPPARVRSFAKSWRTWVTRKLAAYLRAADAADAEGRADFARARLAEEGVDLETWAPLPALWS